MPCGLTSRLSSALEFAADGVSVANGAFGEALARDERWAQPSRADSGNKRRHNALRLPLITAKIDEASGSEKPSEKPAEATETAEAGSKS